MDRSNFDLNRLLKKHLKNNYKNKPSNLKTVAAGVQKRLEENLNNRRTSRRTIFDKIRDLSDYESPVKKSDAKSKAEQRRMQLEKWKAEKEKQKKEAAANKPKPFIAGIAHASIKFVPPPPVKILKSVPSLSGVLTRSQAAKIKAKHKAEEISSFAPRNATFKAPVFKNPNIPVLVLPTRREEKKTNIAFDPVLPSGRVEETCKVYNVGTRMLKNKMDIKNTKTNKSLRTTRSSQQIIQSSSSGHFIEEKIFEPVTHMTKPAKKSIVKVILNEDRMAVQRSSSGHFIEEEMFVPVLQTAKITRKSMHQATLNDNKMAVQSPSSSESDIMFEPELETPKITRKSMNKVTLNKNKMAVQSPSSSESNKMFEPELEMAKIIRKSMHQATLNDDKMAVQNPSSSESDIIFEPELEIAKITRKSMHQATLNDDKMAVQNPSSSESDIMFEPELETAKITRKSMHQATLNDDKMAVQNPPSSESDIMFEPELETPKITGKSIQQTTLNDDKMAVQNPSSSKSDQRLETAVTPRQSIPKSESSSEEKLKSPKHTEIYLTPDRDIGETKISPRVTVSRGKDNALRDFKKKLKEGLLDEDASDMDSINDFRCQMASEIKCITDLCVKWDEVLKQNQLPETVQEHVLAAVGQARLLMSQKMQQFASLVESCAKPEPGAALITPADLQGFWDMVFMQIENVYIRFKKLDELRNRGWVEEKPVEVKKKPVAKPNAKKRKPIGGPSRLREMIVAARRAKKEQGETVSTSDSATSSDDSDSKTFEAVFFSVTSPIRSPATCTPKKPTLLKTVLSNEAKKASASKASASFAILRASIMSKYAECEGISHLPQTPLTPINLSATPGRSILKSANKKNSGKKSIKVVLFDKSDSPDYVKNETSKTVESVESDKSRLALSFHDENPERENSREKDKTDIVGLRDDVQSPENPVSDSVATSTDGKKETKGNKRKSKENKRESKWEMQDAIGAADTPSPIKTRSQRKNTRTPLLDIPNKPQSEKKKKKIIPDDTPKRITRSRKSVI